MHSLPHEGIAEEALSSLLLRFVQDEGDTEELREMLCGFTHRCRNMLNGMKMSLYLVRKTAAGPLPQRLREVEETYASIERLFERLQAIYRPVTLTPICARFGCLVDDRERGWREAFHAVGAGLEIHRPREESRGEFDPSYLGLGLDAFLSWRAASLSAGQAARLGWNTEGSEFHVSWDEPPSPGRSRGTAPTNGIPMSSLCATSSSLGMPLLARIMTAHHGVLESSCEHGFKVRIRWPLARTAPASCDEK